MLGGFLCSAEHAPLPALKRFCLLAEKTLTKKTIEGVDPLNSLQNALRLCHNDIV